jgi:HK97 family phage prohead protease
MIRIVSASEFKMFHRKHSAGTRPIASKTGPLMGVRKTNADAVEKLDDRTLRFTISTAAVDRDHDTINPAGWNLDAFSKNPVVLWAHQSSLLPIGKALDFAKSSDRLASAVRFLPEDGYGAASEFADAVYRLARDGFLSATSVGFRPLAWDFTDDVARGGDDWFPGIDFHEQELVEFSIVTVPANPEALIETPTLTPPDAPGHSIELEARARRRRAALAAMVGV